MLSSDVYNVNETIERIASNGVKKAGQRIDHLIIKSVLAGVLLSFGGLFLLTVGGGSAPLGQSLGSGIQKMIQVGTFPIGLVLIILTGADLFTGNTMTLVVSTLHGKTTGLYLLTSWTISFLGNFLGYLFFQYILVYQAGLLSNEPYRSFAVKFSETKGNGEWHHMFLKRYRWKLASMSGGMAEHECT